MGSVTPSFFTQHKGAFRRELPETDMPILEKIGRFKSSISSIPSANYFHAIADSSTFGRNAVQNLGGASALGETSALYGPIGVFWARDNWQQMKEQTRIGDQTGAAIEMRKFLENGSLAIGSFAIEGTRAIGIASEVGEVIHSTTKLSSFVMGLQTFFNWFSGVFFAIYYLLYSYRIAEGLVNLGKGGDLREELLQAKDPIAAFRKKIELEISHLSSLPVSQREAIAIEEGALWLEKVAKAAKKEGKEVNWDLSDKSFVRAFLLANPEYMQNRMGQQPEYMKQYGTNELACFGKFMAEERLKAKLEVGYGRLLGADAIEAFKMGDREKFTELLQSPSWKKDVIKLTLALVGLAATIVGTVLTGGVGLAVVLTLYGISGLVWILLCDGQAFKDQWESGELKKRDKWILIASVALSVIAFGGLIAMSVFSGGAPIYLCALILTTAWLITNARALYSLYQRETHPWDYVKVVTPEHFRRLIQTKASQEKINAVLKKMSQMHQKGIKDLFDKHTSWAKAAVLWEAEMKRRHQDGFAKLLDRINQARSIALRQAA